MKEKPKPRKKIKNPSPTIKAPDIAGEEREVRKEGVRRGGFSCTGADTVRLHFQRSRSDSGIPLSSSVVFLREHRGFSRAALPGLCEGAPGRRDLPLSLAQTPPEGLGSPAAGRGRAAGPPPLPQIALRTVKPPEWAGKARFWETYGENGRDLRVEAKLKDQ